MNGFTIINPDRNRIAAVAAKHGLKAIKLGMRLNRGYTPTACRRVAEEVTGRKFKARDYDGMIAALEEFLNPLPTVAVWHKLDRCFIPHIPCPGEKRVRIDIFDGLELYEVYAVKELDDGRVQPLSQEPLADWRIDLS